MTIASGSLALASDILKSLNASGYLDLTNSSVLTIASGVVTQATNFHRIAGEGGADDTLDTITLGSGFGDGAVLFLRPSSDSVTITIGHDTGNISCVGSRNLVLDEDHDLVVLIYDSNLTKWLALAGDPNVAVRVYNSATQSVTGGAATTLTFDTESFDSHAMHSTSSNTGRLTCVIPGKYLVHGQAYISTATGGLVGITGMLRTGGATLVAADVEIAAGLLGSVSVQTLLDMAAGDYVEFRVSFGAAVDGTIASEAHNTFFEAHMVA